MPVHQYVRRYVQKVFFQFIWYLAWRQKSSHAWWHAIWPIQGQGQGHKTMKVRNLQFSIYLLWHSHYELADDCWFLNWKTIFKFDSAGCLIFVLLFVSCDFELYQSRNVAYVRRSRPVSYGAIFHTIGVKHSSVWLSFYANNPYEFCYEFFYCLETTARLCCKTTWWTEEHGNWGKIWQLTITK